MKAINLFNRIKENWYYLIGAILLLVLLLYEAQGKGDFNVFMGACRDLFEGKNIYQIKYNTWLHYYYDILFLFILAPFQLIPLYWTKFLWLVLNVFFTYRIWKIFLYYLPADNFSNRTKQIFTLLSFVFIFTLWHKNIHFAQMSICMLYLCIEGLYQIDRDKFIVGGFLIAMGISIKLMPVVMLPYLLYRAKFKASAIIVISLVVIVMLPSLIIGHEYNMFLLEQRWELLNPQNKIHVLDVDETSFHSITSLLATLLVENARNNYTLDLKRNFVDVNLETLNLIINLARAFFIFLTLYFLRSKPLKTSENKLQSFYEISYILLITPLIFPHQQHYAFFFAFPAIAYLVYYVMIKYFDPNINISHTKKSVIIFIAVIIYFLLNNHFILGAYRNIYDHYKTLTYGIIFLILLLMIARPEKLKLKNLI